MAQRQIGHRCLLPQSLSKATFALKAASILRLVMVAIVCSVYYDGTVV
jgi:hypothetical protein